jgi:hypothetical protein
MMDAGIIGEHVRGFLHLCNFFVGTFVL